MNTSHILYSARYAFVASTLVFALGLCTFFAFEPSVTRSATANDSFTVTQTITNEISFRTAPGDVTMVGSIAGLTGGYATGTTMVVINTNNATGYNMTIHFATSTSGRAMQASSTAYINDYTQAGAAGVPDYSWVDNSTGQAAEFGYTVTASTSAEVDQSFLNNGSACNSAGGTNDVDRCWLNPTTSPETIINSAAPNGSSTSTIKFKVAVPNAPSPALSSGSYVATGILTATTNP
ncbi:MAG: hypothetical protein NUW00_01050 [Candidatus Kaiserbacteria bacterium]|nr:hypothetical protein [Candidatus Kaiserbacteria bacterium]